MVKALKHTTREWARRRLGGGEGAGRLGSWSQIPCRDGKGSLVNSAIMRDEDSAIDYHVHTHFSDGLAGPGEVILVAAGLGITCLSITDHDCVDAHREPGVLEAAAAAGVRLISGVEVDCHADGRELEILGYGFDPHHPPLVGRLARVQAQRRTRFAFFCEGLARAGEPVVPEQVLSGATRVPIKVHLYRALLAAGRTYRGGYHEYKAQLDDLGPAPPLEKPSIGEAVSLVVGAGGYALLAHPLYFARHTLIPRLVDIAASAGCVGVELGYPYTFGEKGLPPAEVEAGLGALLRALPRVFPGGYVASMGTDTHDLLEWSERRKLLGAQRLIFSEARSNGARSPLPG